MEAEYRFFNCSLNETYSEQPISDFDKYSPEKQLEIFYAIIDKKEWDDTDDIHAFPDQKMKPIIMYSDHDITIVDSDGNSTHFSFMDLETDMSCD
jgi:hypothetical protein